MNADAVPHLLLVGARPEVVGKLVGLPLAVTVLHFSASVTESMREVATAVLPVDLADAGAVQAAARQVHQRRPIDGVLSLTEHGLVAAALAADALGVRGNPPAAVAAAQDKALMRQRLRAAGLDTTAYRPCAGPDEAADLLRACPGGVVLKPTDGAGSAGVARVAAAAEIPAAWAWASAVGRPVLAEEQLTGPEFSVETLSVDGTHHLLAVTRKLTTGPPHFIEIGHTMPAQLAPDDQERVAGLVRAALTATGQQWGPCHTEVILTDRGPTLVEINPRVGGDRIWEMVSIATGVDLCSASAFALGAGSPPMAGGWKAGSAVRFLTAEPGVVEGVDGVDVALALDGVLRVGDLPAVGATVRPLRSSTDRVGYVLAAAATADGAATAAEKAAARITVRVRCQI